MGGPPVKCHGLCDGCFIILLLVGSIPLWELCATCPLCRCMRVCASKSGPFTRKRGMPGILENPPQVTGFLILDLHWPSEFF